LTKKLVLPDNWKEFMRWWLSGTLPAHEPTQSSDATSL